MLPAEKLFSAGLHLFFRISPLNWYTGDMDAPSDFEKLYNEHYADIRRFIYTIARCDLDLTDDISQNTWQNAYIYYDSLRDASSVRSWLYTIARNEAKRYFANRRIAFLSSMQTLDGEDGEIDVADERDSDFPEALANSELLAKLLGGLGVDEQRLILLYYAYDVDLKEIADMGGINYNTLKSSFRRAMEKLRKAAKMEAVAG